jgi:hypothetical protein
MVYTCLLLLIIIDVILPDMTFVCWRLHAGDVVWEAVLTMVLKAPGKVVARFKRAQQSKTNGSGGSSNTTGDAAALKVTAEKVGRSPSVSYHQQLLQPVTDGPFSSATSAGRLHFFTWIAMVADGCTSWYQTHAYLQLPTKLLPKASV